MSFHHRNNGKICPSPSSGTVKFFSRNKCPKSRGKTASPQNSKIFTFSGGNMRTKSDGPSPKGFVSGNPLKSGRILRF